MKPINVVLTGATGMVGEGVLLECIANECVGKVLVISRKQIGWSHPKLTELLLPDLFAIDEVADQLTGYNACFWCVGKSSVGMTEQEYTRLTYDLTLHAAQLLKKQNPELVFNFVSGASSDSTEQGKVMWARVKGKTENALFRLFPGKAYAYRPGLMKPTKGQKNFYGYNRMTHKIMFPVMSLFFPGCTIQEIAQAMICASTQGYSKQILDPADIKAAADKR